MKLVFVPVPDFFQLVTSNIFAESLGSYFMTPFLSHTETATIRHKLAQQRHRDYLRHLRLWMWECCIQPTVAIYRRNVAQLTAKNLALALSQLKQWKAALEIADEVQGDTLLLQFWEGFREGVRVHLLLNRLMETQKEMAREVDQLITTAISHYLESYLSLSGERVPTVEELEKSPFFNLMVQDILKQAAQKMIGAGRSFGTEREAAVALSIEQGWGLHSYPSYKFVHDGIELERTALDPIDQEMQTLLQSTAQLQARLNNLRKEILVHFLKLSDIDPKQRIE